MKFLQPNYQRNDERGALIELSGKWEQVNILCIYKDKEFGGHYHKHKTERFYVIRGLVKFTIQTQSNLCEPFLLGVGQMIEIEPYDQHTLFAEDDSILVELLSEPYTETDIFKYE